MKSIVHKFLLHTTFNLYLLMLCLNSHKYPLQEIMVAASKSSINLFLESWIRENDLLGKLIACHSSNVKSDGFHILWIK